MNFITDKEKMYDLLLLTKEEFLKSYSYLTEEEYNNTLDIMWEQLGDIPVNETGNKIKVAFYNWDKNTEKEEIWHWFDKRVDGGIGNKYFN